jgi:aminoglycoside phosphotransferase
VASHRFGSERVWLKKAGPRHGKWGYRVMAAVARMVRLDIIKPVPNPGGEAAIATEARRLKQLAAAGLRVPAVLAQQPTAC